MYEFPDGIEKFSNASEEKTNRELSGKILVRDGVFVRQDTNLVKVKYVDVLWLKGDGNYTTVVTRKGVLSVCNILKEFEAILPEDQFIRIHKSYIVRASEINAINTRELLIGTDLIPIGRNYFKELLKGVLKLGYPIV